MSVVAAGAVVAFGKEMVQHAAVLESVESRTKQVFGNSAADIEQWASDSASAMGMSELGVQNLANELGDLLIPLGVSREEAAKFTVETLEAANALSEWTGGQVSVEEASGALTKAMLGEREELKKLGISIKESDVSTRLLANGQADLEGNALQAAKAMATQELVLEKSADALAAYAEGGNDALRAQKDLASQSAQLKDDLSRILAPALNKIVDGLGDAAAGAQVLLGWFDGLSPTMKTMALGIAGVAAAMALLYANPVIAGLALVAGAVVLIGKASKDAKERTAALVDKINELGDTGQAEWLKEQVDGNEKLKEALGTLGIGFDEFKEHVTDTDEEFDAWTQSLGESAGQFEASGSAIHELSGAQTVYRETVEKANEVLAAQRNEADLANEAYNESAEELANWTKVQAGAEEQAEDTAEAVADLTGETYDYASALQEAADPAFAAAKATQRFEEALEEAEEDMVITAEEANTLALAYLESQAAADAADPAAFQAAQDAIQLALQHTSADVSDLTTDLHVLDDTDAIATAKVQVDRSGLRSAEEVIEQFDRVTRRTVHVRVTGIMPSQGTIDRAVARSLRGWGRIGGP
jgi:chromosome segregation ATPase